MRMVIGQGAGVGHQFNTLFHPAQESPTFDIQGTALFPYRFKRRTKGLGQMQGFLRNPRLTLLGYKKPVIAGWPQAGLGGLPASAFHRINDLAKICKVGRAANTAQSFLIQRPSKGHAQIYIKVAFSIPIAKAHPRTILQPNEKPSGPGAA